MEKVIERLDNIAAKLVELKDRNRLLETQNGTLTADNNELRMQLDGIRNEIGRKDEKIKNLNIARSLPEDEFEKEDLKKRVNTYIREIDKCIAILNQ